MAGKNISIPETILTKCEEYQEKRDLNRSEFVRYALEKVFNSEEPDQTVDRALQRAISRWVIIPWGLAPRPFLCVLTTLAVEYPNQSAKVFWLRTGYIGPRETTHGELLAEIRRDFETLSSSQ